MDALAKWDGTPDVGCLLVEGTGARPPRLGLRNLQLKSQWPQIGAQAEQIDVGAGSPHRSNE